MFANAVLPVPKLPCTYRPIPLVKTSSSLFIYFFTLLNASLSPAKLSTSTSQYALNIPHSSYFLCINLCSGVIIYYPYCICCVSVIWQTTSNYLVDIKFIAIYFQYRFFFYVCVGIQQNKTIMIYQCSICHLIISLQIFDRFQKGI